MAVSAYFQVCVLPRPQPTHPEVGEDDLRARMREQGAVVGAHRQTKARLAAPVLQFTGQQLLRLVIVLAIAEVQELEG